MPPTNRNPYNLTQWERPSYYLGYSPDEDFLVYTRTRDSDLLENTNFECIKARLLELDKELTEQLMAGKMHLPKWKAKEHDYFVYTFTASHWGCGWVEHLMLKFLSPDRLQAEVYEIQGALADYPIYDEEAYSEAEWEATAQYWERMCTDRRIELCAEYGISIYASRHDYIPEPLYEQVRAWATE